MFGTRLTRVTRLLRDRDRDRALARVARRGQRLGGRNADRRIVPDVQPALGPPSAADVRRRDRRLGRLGPRGSGDRRGRDGAPPPRTAIGWSGSTRSPARPATSRWPRDAGGLSVHRRLPAGRHGRQPRAAWRDPGWRPRRRHAARAARPAPTRRCRRAGRRWLGAAGRSSAASAVNSTDGGHSMKELLETLARLAGRRSTIGRAVVVRTFGSAPRPEGAVLLYADDGRLAGSVSGGCVEGAAFEEIQQARPTGNARVIRYGISDEQAWDVGLACGGTIDVLVEPRRRPRHRGRAASVGAEDRRGRRHAAAGRRAAGRVRAAPAGRRARRRSPTLVVHDGGRLSGSLGTPATLDAALVAPPRRAATRGCRGRSSSAAARYFIEAFPLRPRLVIVGAVQVAIARSPASRASSATRRSSSTAGRPSPRPSGSRTSTGSSSAGPTRWPTRSASAPTMRSPC